MTKVVAIYVGKASTGNLRVGLTEGIWGFKKHQPIYDQIAPGDVVLLASGFSGGSPRVTRDEWRLHDLSMIDVGVVTSTMYVDEAPVWPDERSGEASYPHRFRFEHRGRVGPTVLGDGGPLGAEVAESFRLSAIAQGRGYVLHDPEGFEVDIPQRAATDSQPQNHLPESVPPESSGESASVADVVSSFELQLSEAGLRFPSDLPMRFVCGLMAKPFVIFTGLSGSGKTQLAIALGRWLGIERLFVAAVRPDWTGAEALFGYENLLLPPSEDGRPAWSVPAELRFMLQAADDPDEPYLLLLDEMNLAHVERYFADVLSGMESKAPVLPNLAQEDDGIWRIVADGDPRLPFPSNLLVVGTVNIDETTYQFSPKVLDRSTCIEIRVATDALVAQRPDMTRIGTATRGQRRAVIALSDDRLVDDLSASLRKGIEDLHRLLSDHGREFGHRTYQEMLRFAGLVINARPSISDGRVLDLLLIQKVLPRVHGSSRELARLMAGLTDFVGPSSASGDGEPRLPLSAEKLARMSVELEATHFTAF